MGPRQSSQIRSKQQQFLANYEIIQELQNQNIRFLQHKQTKVEYLLRQINLNDKKQYLKAIDTAKTKKQQLQNTEHVAPLVQILQKEEDQYCSTFYKLYVLFQYPQRTLDDQINERNLRKNHFSQTEVWSILASCILGLGHLQKKGIKHGCLRSSMIMLSQQGLIKISDPYTTSCRSNYETMLNKRTTRHIYLSPEQCDSLQQELMSPSSINLYKSDIFTLAMVILQCGLLQYQDECYRDQYSRVHWQTLEYNKNRFSKIYSLQLANMLDYMLGSEVTARPECMQLQNYVITDTGSKSFITDARKSLIGGYSKPTSFNPNINKPTTYNQSQDLNRPIKYSELRYPNSQKNLTQQRKPNSDAFISANKGIGVSGLKPTSVMKFLNTNIQQSSAFETRQPQFINSKTQIYQNYQPQMYEPINGSTLISKPKSVFGPGASMLPQGFTNSTSTNFHVVSTLPLSNLPSNISNLPNFGKSFLSESPIKLQSLGKNYNISPAAVSNISMSRPLRNVFPNPFYETRTKVDENLVQVDQQDQNTSRTISQTSRYNASSQQNHLVAPDSLEANQWSNGYNTINLKNALKSFNNSNNVGNLNNPNDDILSSSYNNPTVSNFTTNNYNNLGNPSTFQTSYQQARESSFRGNYKQSNEQISNGKQTKIEGQFVVQTFKLGSRYEGHKLNGQRHGPGKFYYQDGGMYDGQWCMNKMQGYGKLYYQSGKIAYDGDWYQDQFTGTGVLYNQNPDPLDSPYEYDNFDSVEELWTKYEGQFQEDSKNGKGILYLSNGENFQGNFVNDTAQGEGIFTPTTGQKIRGLWENNILIKQF